MQVGPGDDILAGASRQSTQAEPPQHPAEADLDADKFEPVVGGAGEHHVGYAGKSLAHNVDDLGVDARRERAGSRRHQALRWSR